MTQQLLDMWLTVWYQQTGCAWNWLRTHVPTLIFVNSSSSATHYIFFHIQWISSIHNIRINPHFGEAAIYLVKRRIVGWLTWWTLKLKRASTHVCSSPALGPHQPVPDWIFYAPSGCKRRCLHHSRLLAVESRCDITPPPDNDRPISSKVKTHTKI